MEKYGNYRQKMIVCRVVCLPCGGVVCLKELVQKCLRIKTIKNV